MTEISFENRKFQCKARQVRGTEIEQNSRKFKPKDMFKIILDKTKEFKPKVGNINDKRGRILTFRTSIINKWEAHKRIVQKGDT